MNNFTKDYIALAKNEKVQGLRPEIEIGDWLFWNNHIELNTLKVITPFKSDFIRSHVVFIPNGDWLDEAIIGVCKDRKLNSSWYAIRYSSMGYIDVVVEYYVKDTPVRMFTSADNPLLAKISLLIKLLEEQ